jgi:DNA-binding NarL/FixJ family response regulator
MKPSTLVVDDDEEFRRLMSGILRANGFAIVGEAGTVAEAMAAARELRPDAALVDVRLPDGNGILLGREIADLPWSPRVLLTSSDHDAADEISALNGAALPFVPKDELPNAPLRRLLGAD